MKKRTKKSTKTETAERGASSSKPGKVGGRSTTLGKVNWSKVGRQRKTDDDSIRDLAQTLKAIREEKGIPISKLARELEVAPATLIKFEERGHAISVGVVNAIAQQLSCSLEVVTPTGGGRSRSRR